MRKNGIDNSLIGKTAPHDETVQNFSQLTKAMEDWPQDQIIPLAVLVKLPSGEIAKMINRIEDLPREDEWKVAIINGAFLEELHRSPKVDWAPIKPIAIGGRVVGVLTEHKVE
jgi:hypothetical protein